MQVSHAFYEEQSESAIGSSTDLNRGCSTCLMLFGGVMDRMAVEGDVFEAG